MLNSTGNFDSKTGNDQFKTNTFHVIGAMSGTSLDGLDLAFCRFINVRDKWTYEILSCVTVPYDNNWKTQLMQADQLSGTDLITLDHKYGIFIAENILDLLDASKVTVDLISSHGHTVFHKPGEGLTYQIGHGAQIAARTGITTISDFRITDVLLGGQGAPLVPAGDELLFPEYNFCLNLGGFANVSFRRQNQRMAFDICPVNTILNQLTNYLGKPYDRDGHLGRKGTVNHKLMDKLNELPYYIKTGPKSLSKEWLISQFIPVVNQYDSPVINKLRTVYEHIAYQIGSAIGNNKQKTVLISGGGTYNKLLLERISKYTNARLIMPENQIIEFKEALIFAFLGLLRYRKEINCYASVTGAKRDSSTGVIFIRQP